MNIRVRACVRVFVCMGRVWQGLLDMFVNCDGGEER